MKKAFELKKYSLKQQLETDPYFQFFVEIFAAFNALHPIIKTQKRTYKDCCCKHTKFHNGR